MNHNNFQQIEVKYPEEGAVWKTLTRVMRPSWARSWGQSYPNHKMVPWSDTEEHISGVGMEVVQTKPTDDAYRCPLQANTISPIF